MGVGVGAALLRCRSRPAGGSATRTRARARIGDPDTGRRPGPRPGVAPCAACSRGAKRRRERTAAVRARHGPALRPGLHLEDGGLDRRPGPGPGPGRRGGAAARSGVHLEDGDAAGVLLVDDDGDLGLAGGVDAGQRGPQRGEVGDPLAVQLDDRVALLRAALSRSLALSL